MIISIRLLRFDVGDTAKPEITINPNGQQYHPASVQASPNINPNTNGAHRDGIPINGIAMTVDVLEYLYIVREDLEISPVPILDTSPK